MVHPLGGSVAKFRRWHSGRLESRLPITPSNAFKGAFFRPCADIRSLVGTRQEITSGNRTAKTVGVS